MGTNSWACAALTVPVPSSPLTAYQSATRAVGPVVVDSANDRLSALISRWSLFLAVLVVFRQIVEFAWILAVRHLTYGIQKTSRQAFFLA